MKKSLLAFGLVFALAACADQETQPVAFAAPSGGPKIMLNVRKISLTDRSLQPANSAYVGNFTPTISDAIRQWAMDRLQATGEVGDAMIIVKEASLTSAALPQKTGMENWFTREQGSKYTGHAEVSIEANGPQGYATADASATRALTLPENPTAIEKQNAYNTMLNGLMQDLAKNLESAIRSHMGSFVAASPEGMTSAVPIGEFAPPATVTGPSANTQPFPDQPAMHPPVLGAGSGTGNYAPPMQVTAPATIPLSGPGTM